MKQIEVPFEIPETWEWVRARNVLDVRDGTHDTPKYVKTGVPLLTSKNLIDGQLVREPSKLISIADSTTINQRSKVDNGDILMAMIGSIGNPVLVSGVEYQFSVKNVAIFKKINKDLLAMEFIHDFLSFHSIELKSKASGAVQSFVSLKRLREMMIPIPPHNEQIRIIKKIGISNSRVTEYADSYSKLEKLNKEFPDKLRKSILQYAMQGKLVPQDPNDEPVEVLLEKIRQEKQKLFEEGKLKKKELQESIIYEGDDNSYYEKSGKITTRINVPSNLPTYWKWSRLSQIGALIRGSGIKKIETTAKGIGCVRYGELYTTYGFYFTRTKSFTTEKVAEKCKEILYSDVLMTLTGENKEDIGKATVYLGEEKIVMGGDLTKLTAHKMNPVFISLLLNSPVVTSQKSSVATGNIIVHISNDKLGKILVPVPPIMEQAKIVNQVEELYLQISQLPL